jgi:beta-lactamase regulating signal transducer with metallopeptidase domain
MNAISGGHFGAASGWDLTAAHLALFLVKLTFLLGLSWWLDRWLWRSNPRWRRHLWRVTAIGLAVFWLMALIPVTIDVPLLPSTRVVLTRSVLAESSATPPPSMATESLNEPLLGPAQEDSRAGVGLDGASREFADHLRASSSAPSSVASPSRGFSVIGGLRVVWLIGIVWQWLLVVLGVVYVRRIRARSWPVDEELRRIAQQTASKIGCDRRFEVRISPGMESPCLVGIFWPTILLPAGWRERAEPTEVSAILTHELTHLKGGDLFWNALLFVVRGLSWFHPLAWRIGDAHVLACDEVCDATSCEAAGGSSAYSTMLARWAVNLAERDRLPGLAVAARRSHVCRRIHALRLERSTRDLSQSRRWTASVVGICVTAILSLVSLTTAQTEPSKEEGVADGSATVEKKEKSKPGAEAATNQNDQAEKTELLVQLVDDVTNQPMAGVMVRGMLQVERRSIRQREQSNEKGEASLSFPGKQKTFGLSLNVHRSGFVPQSYWWDVQAMGLPVTGPIEFRMVKGRAMSGMVVNEKGEPIRRATVAFAMPITRYRPESSFIAGQLLTDAEGRWNWPDGPADASRVSIQVRHRDYMPGNASGSRNTEIKVVLQQGTVVEGRVVDSKGAAVVGAKARLGTDRFGTDLPEAVTDSAGRFQIRRAPEGSSAVTVQAEGHSPDVQAVVVGKANKELQFVLQPGHLLRVRMVDSSGQPLPNAAISADTWRGYRTLDKRLTANKDGEVAWDGAPPDVVKYAAGSQGLSSQRQVPLVASDEVQVLTLLPSVVFSGRVLDATTGEPIPKFSVQVGSREEKKDARIYWSPKDAQQFVGGAFRLEFDVPFERQFFQVSAQGYRAKSSGLYSSSEGSQAFDMQLERSTGVQGVALQPTGEPAVGAEVAMASSGRPARVRAGRFSPAESSPDVVVTDADGRFKLDVVDEDPPYHLVVLHRTGMAEQIFEERAVPSENVVKLKSWGRIVGTNFVGLQPEADRRIKFSVAPPAYVRRERLFTSLVEFESGATTDTQGHFTLDMVPPVRGTVYRTVWSKVLDMFSESAGWQVPVEVPAGGEVSVRLGGSGRPVYGQMVLRDRPEAEIDWSMSETVTLYRRRIDADVEYPVQYIGLLTKTGRFEIVDVPAGKYQLRANIRDPAARLPNFWSNDIASVLIDVEVPTMEAGRSDEPLDFGKIFAEPVKK